MRLAGRFVWAVRVLMMLVVVVRVIVFQRFVPVLVSVALRQVQPDACGHERRGHAEGDGRRVAQEQDGNGRADERSDGEMGTGSRRPDVPQREHEQGEAEAVTEETDHARCQQ